MVKLTFMKCHETIAQRHAGEHGYNIEKRTVVTATLTSVLDRYAGGRLREPGSR
jgi:hypothetical protein